MDVPKGPFCVPHNLLLHEMEAFVRAMVPPLKLLGGMADEFLPLYCAIAKSQNRSSFLRVLPVQEMEAFVRGMVPSLKLLCGMDDQFLPLYCAIATRKFLFFGDPRHTGKQDSACVQICKQLGNWNNYRSSQGSSSIRVSRKLEGVPVLALRSVHQHASTVQPSGDRVTHTPCVQEEPGLRWNVVSLLCCRACPDTLIRMTAHDLEPQTLNLKPSLEPSVHVQGS